MYALKFFFIYLFPSLTEIRELHKWSLTNKINETLLTDEQEIAPVGLSVRMWVPKTCVSQVFTREI